MTALVQEFRSFLSGLTDATAVTDAELEEVLAAASVGKYAAESDNTNELTEPLPPPDPVNVQNAAVLADVLGAVPRGGWLYLTDPHDDSLHRICLVTLPQGGTTDQVEAPEIAEHVVVVDDRNDSPGHDLYYHRGGGPFSLSEAEPVKDPEQLRELVLEWDGTYQPEADQYARKKKDAAGQTNFLDPQGGGSAGGEWTPYTGPRGGKGWKSNRTGRVLYRDEMPGGHEHEGEHEDDPGPRPEPGQDAQGKQAPAAAAPETPEAKAARLRKEYQELGTRAPAFRAWFGDWEHDAAHASKVIDPETGEPQQQAPVEHSVVVENLMPKVVYHGTPWDRFDEFLKSKLAKGEKLFYGPGFYFTDAAAIAEDYKQHGSGLVDRAGGKLAVPVERVRRELLPALKQKAAKVAADLQYTVKELRLTQDRVAQRSLQRQAEDLESRQYQLHQLEAMILDSTESNVGVAVAKGEHILNAEFGNQFAGWVERPKGHVFSVYLNIRKPFDIDRGKIATADLPEPARSRFRIKQTRPILLVSDEAVTPTDQHWQQMHAALESLPNVSMNFTWQQMKQMMTAEPQRLWGLYQSHPEFRKALRPYNISFQPDVHEVQRPHASYEEVVRQGGLSKSGLQKHLAAQGYDGITHVGHYGSRRGKKIEGVQQHRVWIAFEPHQIKAVDNAGTFDPSNPKIDLARADQPARYDRTDALTAAAPGSELLPVQDIRQRDHYSCGACASMTTGRYFGVGPERLAEWKQALGTTLAKSTHPYAIIDYLRSLGLQVEARNGMAVDDLADYFGRGWPVITPVQDYGHRRSAGASFNYGHYLTVIGVGLGQVFCQDSSIDNVTNDRDVERTPGRVMIPVERFEQIWHDQDDQGRKFVHFGIAVGPPAQERYDREAADPDSSVQARELARWYADGWNALDDAGLEIPESEFAAAAEELEGTGWYVAWDEERKKWDIKQGEEADQYAAERAPKGGIVGANGRHYKGGQWIPAKEVEKLPASEKAKIDKAKEEQTERRRSRGSIDVAKLHEQLEPHTRHELSELELRRAKASFAGLRSHHGELTVHRLEELIQEHQKFLDGIPPEHPNAEGLREQFGKRLKAYKHMLEWAKEHGITGQIDAATEKTSGADGAEQPAEKPPADANKFKDSKGTTWVKAKAGGETSPVNGEFYKGGRWMPIHGLSVKPDQKPQTKEPQGGEMGKPPSENAKQKQPREPMTPEQIQDEKERQEQQVKWNDINASPLGRLKWFGEHPNYKAMQRSTINMKEWKEFAEAIGEGRLKNLAQQLEKRYLDRIEREVAEERANGKEVPEDGIAWEKGIPRHMAEQDVMTFGARKHLAALPSSFLARQLLQSAMEKAGVNGLHEIAAMLTDAERSSKQAPSNQANQANQPQTAQSALATADPMKAAAETDVLSARDRAILIDPTRDIGQKLEALANADTRHLDKLHAQLGLHTNEWLRSAASNWNRFMTSADPGYRRQGEKGLANVVQRIRETLIPALEKAGHKELAGYYRNGADVVEQALKGKQSQAPAPAPAVEQPSNISGADHSTLAVLSEHGIASVDELADATGKPSAELQRHLEELERSGHVEKVARRYGGPLYRLKENQPATAQQSASEPPETEPAPVPSPPEKTSANSSQEDLTSPVQQTMISAGDATGATPGKPAEGNAMVGTAAMTGAQSDTVAAGHEVALAEALAKRNLQAGTPPADEFRAGFVDALAGKTEESWKERGWSGGKVNRWRRGYEDAKAALAPPAAAAPKPESVKQPDVSQPAVSAVTPTATQQGGPLKRQPGEPALDFLRRFVANPAAVQGWIDMAPTLNDLSAEEREEAERIVGADPAKRDRTYPNTHIFKAAQDRYEAATAEHGRAERAARAKDLLAQAATTNDPERVQKEWRDSIYSLSRPRLERLASDLGIKADDPNRGLSYVLSDVMEKALKPAFTRKVYDAARGKVGKLYDKPKDFGMTKRDLPKNPPADALVWRIKAQQDLGVGGTGGFPPKKKGAVIQVRGKDYTVLAGSDVFELRDPEIGGLGRMQHVLVRPATPEEVITSKIPAAIKALEAQAKPYDDYNVSGYMTNEQRDEAKRWLEKYRQDPEAAYREQHNLSVKE